MPCKALVAAMAASLLLAMSSLASACDLSCSFQKLHSGCQSGPVQTAGQEDEIMPPGMDMNQQSHSGLAEAQSDSFPGIVVLDRVSCTHDKCSQASVSVSALGTDHAPFKSANAVSVGVMAPRVSLLGRSYIQTKASPSNLVAISPVSIHLRL